MLIWGKGAGALLLFGILAAVPAHTLAAQARPTRVILFLGDGVGISYWTAALFAADDLAVQQFPVVGLVDTRSTSSKVTDSAAGATAYATGVTTYGGPRANGLIGMGPDSLPRRNIVEIAKARGMATGLLATESLTDASPAAFAAHVTARDKEDEIAEQIAKQDIDVLMGGGRAFFEDFLRDGSSDMATSMLARYTYVEDVYQLSALDTDTVQTLLGLFAEDRMPTATRRLPELWEMTMVALAVLDKNPRGFFLMVESSLPDQLAHGRNRLEAITAEVLDLDYAIGVALDYQERHPETLIVVAADHETGGLAVQLDYSRSSRSRRGWRDRLVARYTTENHTAQMVPLFASGPGAEKFGGIHKIAEIGRLLIEAVER